MEYIVLASSPGIATHGLLCLLNSPSGETVFIEFAELSDAESVAAASRVSATRIVFHGEYHKRLVEDIHTVHPSAKNILLFDTAEAALLQKFARNDTQLSLDSCIRHWTESICQLMSLAEQNSHCSALVDYTDLINSTASILALLNTRLGIPFTDGSVTTTSCSGIAQFIAATALIGQDEAMVFYDDAKALAVTDQHDSGYTEVESLVVKYRAAAINEFQTLLKCLKGHSPIGDITSVIEAQQRELDLANLGIKQLHEENEITQSRANAMRQELITLEKVKQELAEKECELEIARPQIQQLQEELELMQLNFNSRRQELNTRQSELEVVLLQLSQLQQELDDTIEKYSFLERQTEGSVLLEKLINEQPMLGLLRNHSILTKTI